MIATVARSRLDWWAIRRNEQDRLALLCVARSAVCGCIRCDDQHRGEELDALIATTKGRISNLSNQILDATNAKILEHLTT